MTKKQIEIRSTDANAPVSQAARVTLEQRLTEVYESLPPAAKKAHESVENVHQLRVATRRAAAALRLFQDLLPPRRSKRLHRFLSSIRSCAAKARDLDVLRQRLAEQTPIEKDHKRSHYKKVLEVLESRRQASQRPLLDAHQRAKTKQDRRQIGKLLGRVRWRGEQQEPTFAEVARERIQLRAAEFFQAAAEDLTDIDKLHDLRIRGKRLRYALELLGPVLDGGTYKKAHRTMKEIQQRLGNIHDSSVARKIYGKWRKPASRTRKRLLNELRKSEQTAMQRHLDEFHGWWDEARAEELRRQIDELLAAIASTCGNSADADVASEEAENAGH